jgi:hypothetical protein
VLLNTLAKRLRVSGGEGLSMTYEPCIAIMIPCLLPSLA